MKPLRDESDPADPTHGKASRLLGAVAPLSRSDVLAARVLRRIEAGKRPASFHTSRAVLSFAVVLGLTASAGAALGLAQLFGGDANESPVDDEKKDEAPASESPAPPATGSGAARTSTRKDNGPQQARSGAPDFSGTVAENAHGIAAPPPGNGSQSVTGRGAGAAGRVSETPSTQASTNAPLAASAPASPLAPSGASKVPTASASDAKLVHEAVEAMRNGGDAERAAQLLDEYRRRASSGPLAEEALALSIEIALSKKDPRAFDLGRQYLNQYPQGRFREMALRATRK